MYLGMSSLGLTRRRGRGGLILSDNQLVANSKWNDPHVFFEAGGYTMYASCGLGFSGEISIYRLRSTDKVNWTLSPNTPVLVKGAGGAWDDGAVETPSVCVYGGQYVMFYTGYPVGGGSDATTYRIGYATSPDGITWTKFAGNPLLAPSGVANSFDQFIVAEPGVLEAGGAMYLYYTAMGVDLGLGTTLQSIGLTVFNGATWSAGARVIAPNQVLHPRATYLGYSTPQPCLYNGQVLVYFSVVQETPWKQIELNNAISADAMTNWTIGNFPVLKRDTDWCSQSIQSPSPYQDADTSLHLWYSGNDGMQLGLGYRRLA